MPTGNAMADLRRAVACLAIEVPGEVWDDVSAKVEAVLAELDATREALLELLSGLKYLKPEQIAEANPDATALLDTTCGAVQRALVLLRKERV